MSQNSLAEPTSGTLSGLSLVQGLNAALDTLNTMASGASAPAVPEVGQLWHDTGNNVLKIRSEDNTAWISIGALDETNHLFTAQLAAVAATLSGTLPVSGGGTGGTTVAAALTNLIGAGSLAGAMAALLGGSQGVTGFVVIPAATPLYLQWQKTANVPSGSGSTFNYPVNFPNGPLGVWIEPITPVLLNAAGTTAIGNVGTSSTFTVFNGTTATLPFFALSLGY